MSQNNQHGNQLRLHMEIPPIYDYGTWIRHTGVENACDRLALWSVHGGSIWLASDHVAGKSHLLRSFAVEQPMMALLDVKAESAASNLDSGQLAMQWMASLHGKSHWLIDVQAGALPQTVAHALFHILERSRDLQCAVVIAWRGSTDTLPPELSSRLRALEKTIMAPPVDDDVLLQILRASAGTLQWDIREQVLHAMLTYLPRQLDILIIALNTLEASSFEQSHKPGPAWVKQQLTRFAEQLKTSSSLQQQ